MPNHKILSEASNIQTVQWIEVKLWSFECSRQFPPASADNEAWRGASIQTTIISLQFTGQFAFNKKSKQLREFQFNTWIKIFKTIVIINVHL